MTSDHASTVRANVLTVVTRPYLIQIGQEPDSYSACPQTTSMHFTECQVLAKYYTGTNSIVTTIP